MLFGWCIEPTIEFNSPFPLLVLPSFISPFCVCVFVCNKYFQSKCGVKIKDGRWRTNCHLSSYSTRPTQPYGLRSCGSIVFCRALLIKSPPRPPMYRFWSCTRALLEHLLVDACLRSREDFRQHWAQSDCSHRNNVTCLTVVTLLFRLFFIIMFG